MSGGIAEQLALHSGADDSVEQPVRPSALETLADLAHWLEDLSEAERKANPVCRVWEALRVLQLDASRDTRRQLQALLKGWGIKQRDSSNKKKNVRDVHQSLVAAVLVEGNRLRRVGACSSRTSFGNLFRSTAEQCAAETSGRARSRSPQR